MKKWSKFILAGSVILLAFLALMIVPHIQGQGLTAGSTQPTADISQLPPEKRVIEQRYQDARATALAGTQPPPRPFVPTTPEPTVLGGLPRTPAGNGTIIENGPAPFPAYIFVANQWITEVNDKEILVYAGAVRGDGARQFDPPWQGEVIVVVNTPDYSQFFPDEGGEYQTPTKVGPVRIVSADGMKLTLNAPDGTSFVFDVVSRKFVSP